VLLDKLTAGGAHLSEWPHCGLKVHAATEHKQLCWHREAWLLDKRRRHKQLKRLAAEDSKLGAPSPRLEAHKEEAVTVAALRGVHDTCGMGGGKLAVEVVRDEQAVDQHASGAEQRQQVADSIDRRLR